MQEARGHRSHKRRTGIDHVRSIDAELLHQHLASDRRVIVVDVRSSDEFHGRAGHIAGAVWIPIDQLLARRVELEPYRHDLLVIVSTRGASARQAGLELEFAGFDDVRVLEGGLARWLDLGYRVEHS